MEKAYWCRVRRGVWWVHDEHLQTLFEGTYDEYCAWLKSWRKDPCETVLFASPIFIKKERKVIAIWKSLSIFHFVVAFCLAFTLPIMNIPILALLAGLMLMSLYSFSSLDSHSSFIDQIEKLNEEVELLVKETQNASS